MTSLKQFVAIEVVALAALLLVSGAMAAYAALDSTLHSNSLLSPRASAWIGFSYTSLIGAPVALVMGAPTYFILLRRGLAQWPYILLAGATPGLIALVVSLSLGFWAVLCGIVVASLTHAICRRLGPNNKLQPTADASAE